MNKPQDKLPKGTNQLNIITNIHIDVISKKKKRTCSMPGNSFSKIEIELNVMTKNFRV